MFFREKGVPAPKHSYSDPYEKAKIAAADLGVDVRGGTRFDLVALALRLVGQNPEIKRPVSPVKRGNRMSPPPTAN